MNRPRITTSLSTELEQLERDLASLTLRVGSLRESLNQETHASEDGNISRTPHVGDRVRFGTVGRGTYEGVIVAVTAKRIRIRQDVTNSVILRAPQNVTLI
jgi:hypothetical protein